MILKVLFRSYGLTELNSIIIIVWLKFNQVSSTYLIYEEQVEEKVWFRTQKINIFQMKRKKKKSPLINFENRSPKFRLQTTLDTHRLDDIELIIKFIIDFLGIEVHIVPYYDKHSLYDVHYNFILRGLYHEEY